MDFRKAPEIMAAQKAENKKDMYIEVTNTLVEAYKNASSEAKQDELLPIITATLENMDPQIYELYRALLDIKRAIERRDRVEYIGCTVVPEGALELKVLFKTARSVTVAIEDGGIYNTKQEYELFANGKKVASTNQVVTSIYELLPDMDYVIEAKGQDGTIYAAVLHTDVEFVTLNVRDFGAKGDGVSDDTHFIQGAIMACPKNGRVLIPEGCYRITSLFLKSDLRIELEKGACLKAFVEREKFVQFPSVIESYDEKDEYHLGTWEGNPLPMFAGIICGINVSNVVIYGQGTIDGNASKQDWWNNPKVMNVAYRPRLFFINHCDHVYVQGVKFANSPSWTVHPFFSDDLGFYNTIHENPSDSPNTDGLDPESCHNVDIFGVRFSLGDDCIAVKAGKIYMGKKYKRPSKNLHVWQCLMENGHGAVTVGSEMAGGVINMVVEQCKFSHTDRGLRIKTRRGRGRDAIIDQVTFKDIEMDNVMTPFVINSFYFCDPDGKTEYVQSRDMYPVDERTPRLGTLVFENINAKNCHVAACHFDGLPEQPIEQVVMRNCSIDFAKEPKKDVPAMSSGVEACVKKGVFANNVRKLVLDNVAIDGFEGEEFILSGIGELIK